MSVSPARPRCSVFIAISADGYIARADGSIDWLSRVERAGEDYGYKRFFDSIDALVIGCKTYDTVLGFGEWPYADKRCIVLTRRPPVAPRSNEVFFAGAPTTLLEQLAQQGVQRVYVDGGAVIRAFLAEGLIDDLVLSVVPLLLGEGVSLFAGRGVERSLRLESSESFASGLVQLRYSLART